MQARIHPSILSADFMNFESEFLSISAADAIHVDVMDGHFVPNLTFGLPVVAKMAESSPLPLDVHLMIEDVDNWAVRYANTGAKSVTFHQEASSDPVSLARNLRSSGAKASIAVKPGTGLEFILDNLTEFDMILIMTVEPGFGGQRFMENMMDKVGQARTAITTAGLDTLIQVDGGVTLETIKHSATAGADTFVAGSSVFSSDSRTETINSLRNSAQQILDQRFS